MQTFWWNTLWNFSRVSVLPNGAGITQGFGNCMAERVNSPDTTRDQALQLRLQHHLLGLHNVKKKALNALKCYVFPCAVEWANSTRGPSTTRGPRLANNSGAKSTRGANSTWALPCIQLHWMYWYASGCNALPPSALQASTSALQPSALALQPSFLQL